MTGARPDPDSDLAGAESEYGNDTGFAAQSTETAEPGTGPGDPGTGSDQEDTAGLTVEDDDPRPAGAQTDAATTPSGPGDGAD